MNKKAIIKISSTVALLAAVLAAPSAYAQKGSRLCGHTTSTPTGQVIGLLYEARSGDASYTKQCNEVISKTDAAIKADPVMSKMTWTKVSKATCESVGAYFKSTSNPSDDMCDYMSAKEVFKVVKESPAKTSYTKM